MPTAPVARSHNGGLVSYGYITLLCGTISSLAFLATAVTNANFSFHFGYIESHVNLLYPAGPLSKIAWIVTTLLFAIHPVLTEGRRIRSIRYAHFLLPISGGIVLLRQELFPIFAAHIIIAYLLVLHNSASALGISRRRSMMIVASAFFFLIISLETFALVAIISHPAAVLNLYSGGDEGVLVAGRLSLNLFYIADSATPALYMVLIASPILLSIIDRQFKARIPRRERTWTLTRILVSLLGVSALACLAAFLPYFYRASPVGVDAGWYVGMVDARDRGLVEIMTREPRAAYILLLRAFKSIAGISTEHSLVLGAIILSILTTLGSFYFTRQACRRNDTAILSAAMASVTPQLLVGTFAAIFNAWLAFAETLFFFGLTLKAVREKKSYLLAAAVSMSIVIMLTHAWTWVIVMVILAGYALITLSTHGSPRERSTVAIRIVSILGFSLLTAFLGLVVFAFEAFGRALEFGVSWVLMANKTSPVFFPQNFSLTMTNYVGGSYSNWVLLLLTILGVFGLRRASRNARYLLYLWILIPSAIMVFLGSDIQWRLLFLFPYSILGALGLHGVLNHLRRYCLSGAGTYLDLVLAYVVQVGFVASVMLLLWNNVMRSMIFLAAS